MHQVFLGIGGNIGNKPLNFKRVAFLIEKDLGKIHKKSSVYETPPWGFEAETNFWNQALQIETRLEPEELLSKIKKIEKEFGRKREAGRYTSREMDIDILYFDTILLKTEELTIPHPRIGHRLFVLKPLVEIAPEFQHPQLQKTNRKLLESCKDESEIKKINL